MKKLSLDRAWELCIKQRKFVADNFKDDPEIDLEVDVLKKRWLYLNRFKKTSVRNNCFFCEYDTQNSEEPDCLNCPGKLVDESFHCEYYAEYIHDELPVEFLDEIERLYEIYKRGE